MKKNFLDEVEKSIEYKMLFEDEKNTRETLEIESNDNIENLKENHKSMMQAYHVN